MAQGLPDDLVDRVDRTQPAGLVVDTVRLGVLVPLRLLRHRAAPFPVHVREPRGDAHDVSRTLRGAVVAQHSTGHHRQPRSTQVTLVGCRGRAMMARCDASGEPSCHTCGDQRNSQRIQPSRRGNGVSVPGPGVAQITLPGVMECATKSVAGVTNRLRSPGSGRSSGPDGTPDAQLRAHNGPEESEPDTPDPGHVRRW